MNVTKELKPASSFAQQFGVKALLFGGPGMGKTPLLNTAPRPVLLAVEPGLLSMRGSNIPTFEAFNNYARIEGFFEWLFNSAEAKQFDTVGVDSISQIAEIVLAERLAKNKDPRKAYGEMSQKLMEYANGLYFMQNKHAYLIAKQTSADENGAIRKKPYFPGQDLNVKIPHLYDEILHLGKAMIPSVGEQIAIRTKETFEIMARDRSGKCAELEPPNLGQLFQKIMQ
jgi:GTPase SAR1 family protein